MRLEPLEFIIGRKRRILIIQMDDEADGDERLFEMIEKRAATRSIIERPAKGMLNKARLMKNRIDTPELF